MTRERVRPLRKTRLARAVVASWRRLAPIDQGPTLVACSGGADSVALLVALASAEPQALRVAHVRHDMRSESETRADEDHVRALATSLELAFDARSIALPDRGNAEAHARRLRYDALAGIARDTGCRFVATGHHADDQLETFLMRAMRGAGPRGLRAMAERRTLGEHVCLVRPMLAVTHAQCKAFCEEAGVAWREDETNADITRTRAALRARVLPEMRTIRPDVAERVATGARLQRDAHALLRAHARRIPGGPASWDRSTLRGEREAVVGEVLREGVMRAGVTRADALTQRLLTPTIRAIRDESTEPRVFEWPQGVRVEVTAHEVRVIGDSRSGAHARGDRR